MSLNAVMRTLAKGTDLGLVEWHATSECYSVAWTNVRLLEQGALVDFFAFQGDHILLGRGYVLDPTSHFLIPHKVFPNDPIQLPEDAEAHIEHIMDLSDSQAEVFGQLKNAVTTYLNDQTAEYSVLDLAELQSKVEEAEENRA